MSIPTVTVRWPKGSEGKARFDRAVHLASGNANKTARGLLDAWSDLILSREDPIKEAVATYDRKQAKKK